jgi:DNA-binding beta-propeller fold protein YncE
MIPAQYRRWAWIAAAFALGWSGFLSACQDETLPEAHVLTADPNPLRPSDPLWSKQPHRDRPRAVCVTPDQRKAYVMLSGIDDAPGTDISVIDLKTRKVSKRLSLPKTPWGCAIDPSGRWLVVTLRYADRASVIDTAADKEVARVQVPYYTETALFSQDGKRLFLANRWKDSVLWWDVETSGDFSVRKTSYAGIAPEDPMGTPVSDNPAPMALSSDGKRLFVGSVAGCTIAVIDATSGELIDADANPATTTVGAPKGISHLDFKSPVGGLAVHGQHLFIADMGRGLGAQPTEGIDIDDDGKPGDSTANQAFQDQQNEIGVVDTQTLQEVARYTSDTIAYQDFRDVDPEWPQKGMMLPVADQWSADVVNSLPPKDTWIVAGALPEAMAVLGDQLWVAYAGSNEVQGFQIAAGGKLTALQKAGGLYPTAYNPKALAAIGPKMLLSVDRLAEGVSFVDTAKPPADAVSHLTVGDVKAGAFPSTDMEIGEAINEMTAPFTIDGDQTCVQCHRDNGSTARPFVMPLQNSRAWSLRNVMAQRGLYDTRPWFFESAMDETNFFPVLNEFARRENFCCEQLNMMIWAKYPKVTECQKAPQTPGCNHVLNCNEDPPPECKNTRYAQVPQLKRSEFIKAAAKKLLGRDQTFGDALYNEDLLGNRKAIALDFEGMTRAIGLFMLGTPRLLPNPNNALDLPTARRGKALYQMSDTGCNGCHPLPLTTTATLPVPFSPFGMPVRFPPVITPERRPDGSDAMLVINTFISTFPDTVQTAAGLHVGSTPLRGLWDRPQTRFYHDGRARSLRGALATPGHAALRPGEVGHNERDGVRDTHGGTSHLDKYQLEDLKNFLLTL